ncbi:glucosaminylphosphatidylinositol acyltransferase [Pancytospora epiphaga]|nr:glucosaminylphosphatidylinositol acyltransferase [Pancytospora epiphaga]
MIKEPLTQLELYKITVMSIISMIIGQRLFPGNIFAEFLFLAVPQYIAILYMKYSSYLYMILVFALLIPRRRGSRTAQKTDRFSSIIDGERYIIISSVVIAIFTADFPKYDAQSHKLGKSMGYGLQLMDIGVGSFVFNAGLFSPKMSPKRKMRNVFQSLLLGFVRFFTKVYFKLDVDEREFGTHLNFFFLLSILNLLSICFTTNFCFLVGMGLCLIHAALLKYAGLADLLYNTTRDNLFLANIEGISFIIPQFGMFLIAAAFGKCVFAMNSRRFLPFYWLASIFTLVVSLCLSTPNRRLHNLPFCMVIVVLHSTIGACIYTVDRLFGTRADVGLRRFASRHLLFMLLWSNFLVFLRSLIIDIRNTSEIVNHIIFLAYYALALLVPAWICQISAPFPREAPSNTLKSKHK